LLPDDVELGVVRLPGRESRFAEPVVSRLDELVDELSEAIVRAVDGPYAILGNCTGALLAFEVVRALLHRGFASPVALYLASRQAPQEPSGLAALSALSDAELMAELQRLGGTPKDLLANAGLLAVVTKALRMDFGLSESYSFSPGPPLDCPLRALRGRADPLTSRDLLAGWAEHTRGQFDLVEMPGGHFFASEQPEPLLTWLSEDLSALTARPGSREVD
jgi:surfactin synthase thioesterase subunit